MSAAEEVLTPMPEAHLKLARNALGLPNEGRRSYRNRFLAAPGDNQALWIEMVAAGHATPGAGTSVGHWFYLTEDGARAALKPGETLDREDFPTA